MQFTASFLALLSTVIAGAAVANASALQARAGAVEFCSEINFSGNCVNVFNPNGSCSNVGSDLNDQISSIHVESGTVCDVFVNFGCADGASLHITSDISDLRSFGFNDNISSFRCSA